MGPFSFPIDHTVDIDRSLQVHSDRKLLLVNTNFCHEKQHSIAWRPQSTLQRWTPIDPIDNGHQWRGLIEGC